MNPEVTPVFRRRVVPWLVAAAVLLAACGGGSGGGGSPSTPATGGSGAADVVELVVIQGIDIETWDPHATAVRPAETAFMQIYEPLIHVDYENGVDLMPVLAERWEAVDDTTWRFWLRRGVSFTNGEPFNAEAVAFTINRLLGSPDLPRAKNASTFVRAEIIDEYTIDLHTHDPDPLALMQLSYLGIIPPQHFQEVGEERFAQEPVGTGPFVFVEHVRDQHAVLEKNPDYWGGPASIDRLVFKPVPEAATRVAAARAGEAHIVTQIPSEAVPGIEENPDMQVVPIPSQRMMYIAYNLYEADSPFQDPRVRQALNYAVDKDLIIDELLNGHGVKLHGQLLTPDYFGFNPELDPFPYDPDRARSLLAEAGYGDDRPLSFALNTPEGRYVQDREIAEAVAGQLRAVGVEVDVRVWEWGNYITSVVDKSIPNTGLVAISVLPDAGDMLTAQVTGAPYGLYVNERFDALVGEIGKVIDPDRRLGLIYDATRMSYDEPMGIYLHQIVDLVAAKKNVQGVTWRPDELILFHGATVDN